MGGIPTSSPTAWARQACSVSCGLPAPGEMQAGLGGLAINRGFLRVINDLAEGIN